MVAIATKYQCGLCLSIYADEDSAVECWRECVGEEVDVRKGYVCPLCGDIHKTEAEALDCCGYEPEGPPPPPSAAELEAAGQLRLPI